MFSMEVTRNKILICLLLIKTIRNFKVIELPPNIVQLHLYLANHVVLHNGTQLEGEKCKFQKLQNKDHPNVSERKEVILLILDFNSKPGSMVMR